MIQEQDAASAETEGNWLPDNLARIRESLARHGADPAVAVFDFDNTCIFRDVGQAFFRWQLLELAYRIPPEDFAALLPEGLADIDGRPMAAVRHALESSYQGLWPLITADDRDTARRSPDYRLFTTLLFWFTGRARKDSRLGAPFVLPFMVKLLAGYRPGEIRRLAARMLHAVMAEELREGHLSLPAPAPLGHIEAVYPMGLHAHREMLGLMRELRQQGIACYVISASAEWLIKEAVQVLGFPVPEEHIFGIRTALDSQGALSTADPADYPITFRGGKTEIIRRFIPATPLLAAGDADTDYDMLTLPGISARLLINRGLSGLISTLYRRPDILLQGLDLRTGRFRPCRETTGL